MDKIFSYCVNRRDKALSAFRVVSGDRSELLRAISCNSVTGYVVDNGAAVNVPRSHAEAIAKHLLRHGWSLGA